jgi:hypothetical protein
MDKSKLFALLATFSNMEWKHFLMYLESPYLNKEPKLCSIGIWLFNNKERLGSLKRTEITPMVHLNPKQINYTFSWLYHAGLQFLALEKMRSNPIPSEIVVAAVLGERGLEKQFDFQIARTHRILQELPAKDAHYWQLNYNLNNLEGVQFVRKGERKTNPYLQSGSDSLDKFYFSEKLRYACGMMNAQSIVASTFNIHFVVEIVSFLETTPHWLHEPCIAVYYHIWKLMVLPDESHHHYQSLKNLIRSSSHCFSQEENAIHLGFALNFCIRQIRNVKEEYVAEALHLYEEGIQNKALLNDQILSPWHYKNIIRLGLRSGRYEWTEQFIIHKNTLLEHEYRSNALHFGFADLYFYTKRYALAKEHISQTDLSDIYNNLDAKEMLAKIYYETDEDDALFSHLHAFRTFLRRNKLVSEQVRKAYLNFLKLLEQSIHYTPDMLQHLKATIEKTEPLVAKSWLLEKCR